MKWIVRVSVGGDGRIRYATVDPEGLHVRYRETMKPKGKVGPFVQVEHSGWDKSTVDFGLTNENAQMQRGNKGGYGSWVRVKLIHSKDVVRAVKEQDIEALEAFDRQVAELEAQIKAIRDERAEFIKGVWRRGEKIGMSELEDPAKASLAEIEARKAGR